MAIQSFSKNFIIITIYRHENWFLASSAIILVIFLSCHISIGQAEAVVATVTVVVGVGAKPEFLISATAPNKSASVEELKLSQQQRLDCSVIYPYCCSSSNPCPDYYDYCDPNTRECKYCGSFEEWDGQKCVYCKSGDHWNGTQCIHCNSTNDNWNGTSCIHCAYPDSWDSIGKICRIGYYSSGDGTNNTWMYYTYVPIGFFVFILLTAVPACCVRCRNNKNREREQNLAVTSVHTSSTVPSGSDHGVVPEPEIAGVIIGQFRFGHDAYGNPVMLSTHHILMDASEPAPVHHQDPRQMAGRDLPPPYYPPSAPTYNNRY